MMHTALVMSYCNLSITILCLNVVFDLFIIGFPLYCLKKCHVISKEQYVRYMTSLVHWTTPIVYSMPLIFSGSRIYCDNMHLMLEARNNDSLMLANHGSRIDWMLAMFVGHNHVKEQKNNFKARVGFVCESIIQYMPIVGWYRAMVCEDIFVRRSFLKDASTIAQNISVFHNADEKRMVFLSPEGVVVDFSERDKLYIKACREYCVAHGYEPFQYVLTPRHKGTEILMNQIERDNGPIISVCMAYVRNGKLLNCQMSSPDRKVPDIYMLNEGTFGEPVDVYLFLRQLPPISKKDDLRVILMDENKWKDSVLKDLDEQLQKKQKPEENPALKLFMLEMNRTEAIVSHMAHAIVIISASLYIHQFENLILLFFTLLVLLTSSHALSWILNTSSMESVPFETGIKSFFIFADKLKHKTQ